MTETVRREGLVSHRWGGGVRLFCFPPAGGNSGMFKDWGRHLPAGVQVQGVELPGRQKRYKEPLAERVGPLVASLLRELRPSMTFPIALFGHSLGALLAFEFARAMRREGLPPPAHLLVSSYSAPQLPRPGAFLHKLPGPLFQTRVAPLLPPEVMQNRELFNLLLPIMRADITLYETYQYTREPPLDCPITALGGAWDLSVPRAALQMWAHQTSREFGLHLFPGAHYYTQTETAQLLETIGERLEPFSKPSY